VEAGCLRGDSQELFEVLFSPVGLQQVLSLKQGCYLQFLSKLYGFVRLSCGRCGLCVQGKGIDSTLLPIQAGCNPSSDISTTNRVPTQSTSCLQTKRILSEESQNFLSSKRPCTRSDNVVATQKHAEAESRLTKVLHRKAKWVFTELQYRCLACGKSLCNGECAGGCYRCGSRYHRYNVCTYDVNRLAKILPNKGVCFGCFDTSQHHMTSHDIKSCPLKRRLKRLLFLDHSKRGNDFEEYLRQLYSCELSFVRMVASFSDQTSLGR
jgi:hypothetical protein